MQTSFPTLVHRFLLSTLFVLGICVNYPIVTGFSKTIAAFCLLFMLALFQLHEKQKTWRDLALAGFCLFLLLVSQQVWTICVTFAISFCYEMTVVNEAKQFLRGIAFSLLCFSGVLFVDGSGLLWQETSFVSWRLSEILTMPFGEREKLGTHFIYFSWFSLSGAIIASRLVCAPKRYFLPALLLMIWVISFAVAIINRQIAIAIGLPILFGTLIDWDTLPEETQRSVVWSRAGATICCSSLALLVFLGMGITSLSPVDKPKLAMLDGGMKTIQIPDSEDFSQINEAKFGAFTRMLPEYGWEFAALDAEFNEEDLSNVTVLMVVNPTNKIATEKKEAIYKFVRAGGRLLVLGDHTNIGGIMDPLNDLLSETSIQFLFDSAIPLDQGWKWRNCVRGGFHPAFFGKDNGDIGISVGASLEVGPQATVVYESPRSYSDWGRPDFGVSRLGDMAYNIGESHGGLPLVAEQKIGNGLVQVWGDTAGFQDGSIDVTGKFHAENLNTLARRNQLGVPKAWMVGVSVVMLTIGVALLSAIPATVYVVMLAMVALPPVAQWMNCPTSPLVGNEQLVMMDYSHGARYPAEERIQSHTRFGEVVLRSGHISQASFHFSDLASNPPHCWVINAPTKNYSSDEVESLYEYVASGGRLLISVGADQKARVQLLLDRFDLDVSETVYGAAHNSRIVVDWEDLRDAAAPQEESTRSVEPVSEFTAAYDAEIQFRVSHPVIANGAQTLVECWGRPLIVQKEVVQGKVVLIGDSRFILNENLESGTGAAAVIRERNARFLIHCLND